MSELTALANDYFGYRQSTDHQRLLWRGDLDQIEHWEDISPEGLEARIRRLRDAADRAEALEPSDSVEQALADTIAFTARSEANQLLWRTEREFPNPAIGLVPTILTFLPKYSLVTAEHGVRYHEKLHRLPEFLETAGRVLRASETEGRLPLARHLTSTIAAIDAQLTKPDSANPLLSQPPPTELADSGQREWASETERLVRNVVHPALARYRDAMAAVADQAPDDALPGLCHIDGGAELYRDLVWSHTSLPLTGERVHEIGLEQIERLEDEYRRMAGPIFGTDDITEIYSRLRDDPELAYGDGATLVSDATRALDRAGEVAPDWFQTLPESPCIAAEIAQGALAFYSKPIPEVGKPGRFFFNTSDPSAWKKFQLEAVTFHESIPGHHLQLALGVESKTLHGVHTELPVTVYSEGWGLYTERLADEMGLYSSDLDRIGMLAADSMRACRLVTDTGMHALGWSRDEAIDYVLAHSPLSRGIAEGEIDRYIGMPGQALSYMIGRLEIDGIRAEAEQRPDFEIKAFHDAVLRHGAVPMKTLRRLVLG
jgi:uncharacterized protein (DUF885 family)